MNILIYPNPFSTSTTIEFDNLSDENQTLTIYNSTGQLVRKIQNITTGKIIINGRDLNDGLYFIEIMNNSEIVGRGKLILAR